MSSTSVRRILHNDLSMHPYKLVVAQQLKFLKPVKRKAFSELILNKLKNKEIPFPQLLITEGAHFYVIVMLTIKIVGCRPRRTRK